MKPAHSVNLLLGAVIYFIAFFYIKFQVAAAAESQ
jgi:hypothetical protein